MAWSRVQTSTVATSADAGTIAPSWPGATTAGNLLVAVVSCAQAAGDVTVTAPGAPDWTLAVDSGANTPGPRALIYYIENAGSRSGSETFSLSANRDSVAWLIEYSGGATSGALDVVQSGKASAAGNPITTGQTAALADTAGLAITIFCNRVQSSTQGAPGNAHSSVEIAVSANATDSSAIRSQLGEKLGSLTGTGEGSNVTISTGRPRAGAIAVFLPAAGESAPAVEGLRLRMLMGVGL